MNTLYINIKHLYLLCFASINHVLSCLILSNTLITFVIYLEMNQMLPLIKAIEEGIVNLILGDFCLQIDCSTVGKDHSLKELFHICNPHILDRILRSCFTSWNLAIFLLVQSGNQIHIVDANYYVNQCLKWFRFFLPWVGNFLEIV